MVMFRVWELRAGRLSVRDEDIPESFFSIDEAEEKSRSFFQKTQFLFSITPRRCHFPT